MPWDSGVLRGSDCFATTEEKDTSEITSTNARQRQLRFIARCLAAQEKAVKWERGRPDRDRPFATEDLENITSAVPTSKSEFAFKQSSQEELGNRYALESIAGEVEKPIPGASAI
jgi:hypothetical protein